MPSSHGFLPCVTLRTDANFITHRKATERHLGGNRMGSFRPLNVGSDFSPVVKDVIHRNSNVAADA